MDQTPAAHAQTGPELRLRLFGPPALHGPAGPRTGPAAQPQVLALLAVLACAGQRGMAREKIQVLLWPEADAERSSHRLSQLAHHARRCLECPDLVLGAGELRLNPARVACDLWEFAEARRKGELARAVELYAGPFLDGFFPPDAPELERWIDARRSALAREYGETLEALAVEAEVAGDARAAAGWWRRLAEHEPLSSRVTMHLMTALAAAGDRARALEQARSYQAQLREELEAEPNPAVVALAARLKQAGGGTSPDHPPPEAAGTTPVAIGILPLESLDDAPEAGTFAQGLTEELMAAAAALPSVRVASRTSVTAMRKTTPDLRELGARLGLAAVLEGSVRYAAGRARLSVRLVDVRDGCQRWSARFDRETGDGFEGQEKLAREVAAALAAALG
ncbi:MAG TPA: BTAD domain-containing putative transcriptional regulator [Gemmatimonadales bacterium]|nr:BTAD domain-containing putative transcriptional regulator [Gemmatimonadales bacterium]